MRFRTGAIVGFAVGYYVGARAGRERYEQLRRVLDALPIGPAVEKTQALVELAVERARTADNAP
jgi:membrane protein DedA with SNARE-associated domain